MKLCVISDIHMREQYASEVSTGLEQLVDKINSQIQPDRVIIPGDLIEHGDSAEQDIEYIQTVKDILDNVNAEVTYLLGNHDIMNASKSRVKEVIGQEFYGSIPENNLIFLDSSSEHLGDPRGEITDRQLDFLDNQLSVMSNCILFVHHPIHYHNLESNDWFKESPEWAFCGNKNEVKKVIEKHGNVIAVINGHLHETDYTFTNDVHHVTINAFSKEERGTGVSGTFAVVELNKVLQIDIYEGDDIRYGFEIPI